MNRRNLLKGGLLAGAAYILPRQEASASTVNVNKQEKTGESFAHLSLGELELILLSDGHILQQPVQPFLAPRAPEKELQKLLYDNFRPIDKVDLAMNTLLIKSAQRLILLDTGMGFFADAETGHLLNNLKAAGYPPENITDIFISHAHPDHIGGVINKSNELVFPNADIFISDIEYKFWQKASLKDFTKSELRHQPEFLKQLLPPLQNLLKVIKPKVKFYNFNKPTYDAFSFELIPGHTPGMVAITIQSKGQKLIYIADLIHHDVLLFAHPEWGFSGDTDIDEATVTRKKVLKQLESSRSRVFAYHLPWPGLGYVGAQDESYRWFPEAFARL